MKTGIIILARMNSSRLPGKVLLKLCGKTVLEHVVGRLQKITGVDEIIVATTLNPKDAAIESLCGRIGVSCFRGNEENVLLRCIEATEEHKLDVVVRLGADSPLIDREVIADMLQVYEELRNRGFEPEYLSNTMDRSYPLGLDAEIFKKETFLRIDDETKKLLSEERKLNEINVIPYLHQHKELFQVVSYKKDFDYSAHRWTLDTPEDFELIRRIYEGLFPTNPDFFMQDVLDLLEQNPDWSLINSKVPPRSGFWTEKEQEKLHKRLNATKTEQGR